MTRRERQLLEWIRENPCISQQELADKAGITRSSAAVHISNLMRKGYIAGRGYLLREAPRPGDHLSGRRGTEHRPQSLPAG